MGARFALLCLEMRHVYLLVCLAAPPKFIVVFGFVGAIALDALETLDSARKSHITPPPVVFILGYAQIHVSTSNYGNILANIEALIDKTLSFASTLKVLYIYPNDRHV